MTKYFVLSAAGADNVNGKVNDNFNGKSIISTIKDSNLYVPYQQERIKNYHNFLAKDLKDQFVGMNIKQKWDKKQMSIDIFSNQILLESIDYLYYFIWR